MPTQIGLIDGTTLHVADDNKRPDDIIEKLGGRDIGHPGGFVLIAAHEGDYRVRPEHVTYVRWIDERVDFIGGAEQ